MLDRKYKNLIKYVWGNDGFQNLSLLAQKVLFLLARGDGINDVMKFLLKNDNPKESLEALDELYRLQYIGIYFDDDCDNETVE